LRIRSDVVHAGVARLKAVAPPSAVAVALLVIWELGVRITGTKVFPPPATVALALQEFARSGVLLSSIGASLFRVGVGFLAGSIAAVPLGLWFGRQRTIAATVRPVIELLRPISPLAWIPVSIVLFGISNAATMVPIFLATFLPLVTTVMEAAASVPHTFLCVAENFGLRRRAVIWRVVVPSALPEIITGLRLALGVAWVVLIAAEMIAVDSGLGYLIMDARNAGKRYDRVIAAMVVIGLVGFILDLGMRRLTAQTWIAMPAAGNGRRTDGGGH